jgi:hypothetical protein
LHHGAHGVALALAGLGAPALAGRAKGGAYQVFLLVFAGAIALGLAGIGGLLYDVGDPFDNPYAAVYRRALGSFVPGPSRAR